mmetsp:Transcript_91223/g.162469  ORF Transcript_91223/g.162469 Transcript_91223/m.162469 type:complete len:137 (+) Transcript_91223:202-612(+)
MRLHLLAASSAVLLLHGFPYGSDGLNCSLDTGSAQQGSWPADDETCRIRGRGPGEGGARIPMNVLQPVCGVLEPPTLPQQADKVAAMGLLGPSGEIDLGGGLTEVLDVRVQLSCLPGTGEIDRVAAACWLGARMMI